jgi:hypothetical protein
MYRSVCQALTNMLHARHQRICQPLPNCGTSNKHFLGQKMILIRISITKAARIIWRTMPYSSSLIYLLVDSALHFPQVLCRDREDDYIWIEDYRIMIIACRSAERYETIIINVIQIPSILSGDVNTLWRGCLQHAMLRRHETHYIWLESDLVACCFISGVRQRSVVIFYFQSKSVWSFHIHLINGYLDWVLRLDRAGMEIMIR